MWLVILRSMSFTNVGELLFISEKSVRRYVELFFRTGDVQPTKQKHGPQLLLSDFEQTLVIQLIIDKPSVYLNEIQAKLCDATGTIVHESTICRTIHHLGFTRKKIEHIAFQRSDDLRANFKSDISIFDPNTFVWVDESGFRQRNSIRSYGYSLRGMRAEDHQLKLGKLSINVIGMMSISGMEDIYVVEENVNGDIFEHFVATCLLPQLMPFNGVNTHSVVIMDNCSVHHLERITQMITSTGALLKFLPPYSPDLNPIELVFSKAKSFIKSNYMVIQSTINPRTIISMAFNTVTQDDCISYVRSSGYIY